MPALGIAMTSFFVLFNTRHYEWSEVISLNIEIATSRRKSVIRNDKKNIMESPTWS
tara:strand:+ start:879 stop:1046 length:168 start_codon:yes stop_codon:yes gene_type:complete